jgi:hypothetical protein
MDTIILILSGNKTRSFSKVTIIDQNSLLRIYYQKLFMYCHFTVNTFLPVSSKTCNTMKLEQILYIWS